MEPRPDVVLEADEVGRAARSQLPRERFELGPVGAVADHHERRIDAALVKQPHRPQTSWARFTAVIRPTQPIVNRSRGDAERGAQLVALLGALHALGELDAEPHDRELRRRRDADREELVAHLGADGDERIGLARERPLDDPVGFCFAGPK